MVAQRGTLTVIGDGAFMVLSLPASAFKEFDDDGDGMMSKSEFTSHRQNIVSAVNRNIRLAEKSGPRPLQGMMLSPVTAHSPGAVHADQLVVMGRFQLSGVEKALQLHIGLYGDKEDEQILSITTTRKADNFKQVVTLTPEYPTRTLFGD